MAQGDVRVGISVADTAKWVAYYRAMESSRPDAIFNDPYAERLAGPEGKAMLGKIRWAKMAAWPNIVRTASMDEIILNLLREGVDVVINLAAGLDARPYRLPLPASLQWVEIDYPQTIEYKSAILASETPRCKLDRIGMDLAEEEERRKVFSRLAGLGSKVLVVSEGLLVYLTPEQVGALARDLHDQPNFVLWVTDIANPWVLRMMKRSWATRVRDAQGAAFKFAPPDGAGFFTQFGWRLREYRAMIVEARRFKREPRSAWLWSLFFPLMRRREATRRTGPMLGVLILDRAQGS